jgi:hypothetical protein
MLFSLKTGTRNYTYYGSKLNGIRSNIAFFLAGIMGVESNRVHSALRPTIDRLFQPRVIMMMEKLVE